MASLLLICRRCGREAEDRPSEWAGDSLCVDCHLTAILMPYRLEMVRLWRKFSHHVSKGISVVNLDHQIQNKFRRGFQKARNAAPDAESKRVSDLCVHLLITEAQSAAAGYNKIVRAG